MYLDKDIIKEGNLDLRRTAEEVKLPLSAADIEVLRNLYEYVVISAIPELVKQYNIKPGVGLAAPQVDVNKRMFAINVDDFLDDNKRYLWAVVNPKIVAHSNELTYLPGGEGCLSVTREIEGITPRYYNITVKCHLYDFKTNKLKFITKELEGYPAIVFQHEFDHLNGVLFVDNIENNPKNIEPLFDYETDDNNEEED